MSVLKLELGRDLPRNVYLVCGDVGFCGDVLFDGFGGSLYLGF
jgi:hypothetical protein